MTTPTGASVSNYFRVKNVDDLVKELAKNFSNVTVMRSQNDAADQPVLLYAIDGYWPIEADDEQETREDFIGTLCKHVAEDDLAILHSISMQGPTDIRFQSISLDSKRQVRSIELPEIEMMHRMTLAMSI